MVYQKEFLEALIPLYYVHIAGGLLKGRTRMQKLVFLFQMKSQTIVDYEYKKGDYGSFSYKLYTILENLVSVGLLIEKKETTPVGNEVIIYELTEAGKSLIDFACKSGLLTPTIRQNLEQIFKEYGTLPLIDLIAKVYKEYPKWAEKSIFTFL